MERGAEPLHLRVPSCSTQEASTRPRELFWRACSGTSRSRDSCERCCHRPRPYGPLQGNANVGPSLIINGLLTYPTTTNHYRVLVIKVHLPAENAPSGVGAESYNVAVEVGLARNVMVARTILDSIRAG